MNQLKEMNLEALKAREKDLLLKIESNNSKKTTVLQKHRQLLLNSAHFLRLYHQSSKEAAEILKGTSVLRDFDQIEVKDAQPTLEEDCDALIRNNGLRLLWDSLENIEFLKSFLLLQYLKCTNLINQASLEYFEIQLSHKCIEILISNFDQFDSDHITSAFVAIDNDWIMQNIGEESTNLLEIIIKINENLKKLKPFNIESVKLFIESGSNFCEFSQLIDIAKKVPEFSSVNDRLEGLKSSLRNLSIKSITKLLENGESIERETLEKLELEAKFIDEVMEKINELKLKGSSQKLKIYLNEFFDRLMKTIQTSIRSNTCSNDEALTMKLHTIIDLIIESKQLTKVELESLIQSFSQTITNKSNIIFTIHRNELATLNKSNSIPISSKLYLGVTICDLLTQPHCHNNHDLVSFILILIQNLISDNFFNSWLHDTASSYEMIKSDNNEIFALMWLSNSFNCLHISTKHKAAVLEHLNIDLNRIETLFCSQSSLLSGILQSSSKKINSPDLQSSPNLTNSSVALLKHFIPQ